MLTDDVKAALKEAEAAQPADGVVNTELFQLKDFIDRGIYYVEEAVVIGAVLVEIVLFLFFLNLHTTFITLTAIPLSLVITTLVFRLVGMLTGTEWSINVMTLGGIAVAIGDLVDDAIVDVENIFRRLSENNASPNRKPAIVGVFQASRKTRSAIIFGTAVVVLAFMPLLALSGVEGRLFVLLGVPYIVSILASFLVSLTVTPVLSYYLLPPPGRNAAGTEVGRGVPHPRQHAAGRRPPVHDLGDRRFQRVATDEPGGSTSCRRSTKAACRSTSACPAGRPCWRPMRSRG